MPRTVSRGVKEITLLGQIVTSYGKRDIDTKEAAATSPRMSPVTRHSSNPPPFVQLLDAVHEIDGLERIRFTSPHPKGYGDDLVTPTRGCRNSARARTFPCKAAATAS
jgi:tRNA-2-methylthio-N6-dimethylallyladenosine synthase